MAAVFGFGGGAGALAPSPQPSGAGPLAPPPPGVFGSSTAQTATAASSGSSGFGGQQQAQAGNIPSTAPSTAMAAASRARVHAVRTTADAIRSAASLGTALPESIVLKATSLLKEPYAAVLKDIAAQQASQLAHTSSVGAAVVGDDPADQAAFQPFEEASHVGCSLLAMLLATSSNSGDDVMGLVSSMAPHIITSILQFLVKAPAEMRVPMQTGRGNVAPSHQRQFSSTAGGPNASSSLSHHQTVSSGGGSTCANAFMSGGSSNPLLIATQVLFLLTRRFQCTDQHLREVSAVMDVLLDGALASASVRGGGLSVHAFRALESTQNLCTALYLTTWSYCNVLSPWSRLLPTASTAQAADQRRVGGLTNALVQIPTVAPFVEQWLHAAVERLIAGGNGGASDGGAGAAATSFLTSGVLSGGGQVRSDRRTSTPGGGVAPRDLRSSLTAGAGGASRSVHVSGAGGTHQHSGNTSTTHQHNFHYNAATPGGGGGGAAALPLAFLPIIAVALGAYYVAKSDLDKASDWIVCSALGHGAFTLGGLGVDISSSTMATSPLAVVTLGTRGKVFRRISQLAPLESTLAVPLSSIIEVPLQMCAFILDDALPALHRVAELDLKSYHQLLETQREEELAALQHQEHHPQQGGEGRLLRGFAAHSGGSSTSGGTSGAHSSVQKILSSGFSHLAVAIAWCLDRVPLAFWSSNAALTGTSSTSSSGAGVDNDDDDETAITFFTFQNGCAHVRAIFELQRQDALWEPFAHKTLSSFLVLLASLCRHAPTAERVAQLLGESQVDCAELHWSALLSQARECAGIGSATASSSANLLDRLGSHHAPPTHRGVVSATSGRACSRYTSAEYITKQQERFLVCSLALFRAVLDAARVSPLQQQEAAAPPGAAVSLLLQQPRQDSVVVAFAARNIQLDNVMHFFQSTKLSAAGLGEVLLLLSALITNPADGERVWGYLEESGMLKAPSAFVVGATSTGSTPSDNTGGNRRHRPPSTASGVDSATPMSLLGHAQREVHLGSYPITKGLLALVYNVFGVLRPSQQSHVTSIRGVVKFVAEEIAAGARRRTYVDAEESHVILALSCAVLTQASNISFADVNDAAPPTSARRPSSATGVATDVLPPSSGGVTASSSSRAPVLPLNLITASFKAPMDVLGDLLDAISSLASASMLHTLLPVEVCVLRQAVVFLKQVITMGHQEGSSASFPLEARTVGNVELVSALLKLTATCDDPIVAQESIHVLSLLNSSTHSITARYLATRPDVTCRLREAFSLLLDPQTVNQVALRVYAPLRTLSLRYEAQASVAGFELRTKALFLDLMTRCALMPEPSLFSWLVGGGSHTPHRPLTPPTTSSAPVARGEHANSWVTNSGVEFICLEALVQGVNDRHIASSQPTIHLKYIRLLYLLKVHHQGLLQLPGVCSVLCARSAESYLAWVLHCGGEGGETAESIAQHGLCLKTLALDTYRAHATMTSSGTLASSSTTRHHGGASAAASSSMSARFATRIMDALLSDARGVNVVGRQHPSTTSVAPSSSLYPVPRHLQSTGAGSEETGDGDGGECEEMVLSSLSPFREWPAHVLRSLELFPSLPLPPGGLEQFIRVTPDSVPQYSIPDLYRTFLALVHSERELEERSGARNANHSTHPPTSLEDALRERLTPYVHANSCLVSYASAIQFVEGWSEVIEVATSLTLAAQDNPFQESHIPAAGGGATTMMGGTLPSQQHQRDAQTPATIQSSLRNVVRALSIDEMLRYVQCALEAIDVTSNFTVAAQEQLASTLSRTVSTLISKLTVVAERRTSVASTPAAASAASRDWNRADVQRTLGSLLNTLCLLGPRSAALRSDLYNSLVMFLALKDLPIDPVLLFRAQAQLFSILLTDINEISAPMLQLSAIHCLRTLLDLSPQLCDAFCCGQHGSGSCAPTLSQFVGSALNVIDELALHAMNGGGDLDATLGDRTTDDAMLISRYVVRGILDILLLASVQHADAVHRSNAFLLCNRMRLWAVGTRQALDFVSAGHLSSAGDANMATAPLLHSRRSTTAAADMLQSPSHALLQQILIGVLRWYNRAIHSLSQFEDAVIHLADIVNESRLLMQLAVSPGAIQVALHLGQRHARTAGGGGGAVDSIMMGSAGRSHDPYPRRSAEEGDRYSASTLISVVYEVSELLLNFSQTALVSQCQDLISTFAVPSLIRELLHKDARSTAGGASSRRHLSLCQAVKNFTFFLVSVQDAAPSGSTDSPSDAVKLGGARPVVPLEAVVDILSQASAAVRDVANNNSSASSAGIISSSSAHTHQQSVSVPASRTQSRHNDVSALQCLLDVVQASALLLLQRTLDTHHGGGHSVIVSNVAQSALSIFTDDFRRSVGLITQQGGPSSEKRRTTFSNLTAEFQHEESSLSPAQRQPAPSSSSTLWQQRTSALLHRSLSKAEIAVFNLAAATRAK